MSDSFTDTLFSWSLEDILNEQLYGDKVEKISESFETVNHYLGSYMYPLLEETRAQLCSSMERFSSAPFAEVISFEEIKPYGVDLYNCQVDGWRNRFSKPGEPYKTLPGDIFILADFKPETVSDLQRIGKTWIFASVKRISEDEEKQGGSSTSFKVKAAVKNLDMIKKSMFVIFMFNILTHKRIWNALNFGGKSKIVKEILCPSPYYMTCRDCSITCAENFNTSYLSSLNDSQVNAVLSCIHKISCEHKSSIELIWGPPGTGKTKTVSFLLFNLMRNKCRTVTVAPTNVAIVEVASRVLKLVKDRHDHSFHPLGDVLLFGNKERLKVDSKVEEIYLDYRVRELEECFVPQTGWRHCFVSMIDFLEDCVSQYKIFSENALMINQDHSNEIDSKNCKRKTEYEELICKSFLEFARKRFTCLASPLRRCISIFFMHIPINFILEHNFQNMVTLISSLESFELLLFRESVTSDLFEELFTRSVMSKDLHTSSTSFGDQFSMRRSHCLSFLKTLQCSLNELKFPSATNIEAIKEFCCQNASLIFCTASSSYRLYSMNINPFRVVVIDEAAQLKECESLIPLQLHTVKHAILIGDECQLPAFVESKLAEDAGFGRSLFERLSSLGQPKHLLDIQYRMHPSISLFPNLKFYSGLILDGLNVKSPDYQRKFLPGAMFGPYTFININDGREEKDDVGHSRKNMVEVAVVLKIVQSLYQSWTSSKEKLSIGVISPYSAQVAAIQEKVGRRYDELDGFTVKVKSVDGFQGGEEDVIIISTVRSNRGSSVGFLSSVQRTNVALTRARYCLWVLGNDKTLSNSESIWADLVFDAKKRGCFFDADKDEKLVKAILDMKKEIDQLDDLLNGDSILFSSARWKTSFSDRFHKSFKKLRTLTTKSKVLNLLLKLAGGWRPNNIDVDLKCGNSTQILKQFKSGHLCVVCAIDIALVKQSTYTQVLKVWDILPSEDVSKLIKQLDGIFCTYTDEYISFCQEICYEGKLEVPKTWETSSEIVRYKSRINDSCEDSSQGATYDGRSYVENSKVKDSLLLMKFYTLSFGMVSHLLSERDDIELDLPFEVTDEELNIILYPRSTFILGRSGTGKTTVLTMKLFQKEKLYHLAAESYGVKDGSSLEVSHRSEITENPTQTNGAVLRQLFLTVSPKLCYAVRQHVSHLKSHACGGNITTASFDMENMDDLEAQFMDVPDSLANLPQESFPLVITFYKFLMMLDGTLCNSYFDRFCDAKQLLHGQISCSRSVALQTFIRNKEVNYDRFSSSYWPHFNTQLTKKLDCSRVFTEIISHIKGDLQAIDIGDEKLSRNDYVTLSQGRASSLTKQDRENIYDIFQSYEKLKMMNREFDLADFVIDLHRRLRDQGYDGEEMDFVYIDEVQDLTMSQIALFSYICKNVEEGFVFSGDTAQTIARGIDFRFQDIKSLFYKKFVLPKISTRGSEREDKGQISEIFHLSQNFRTHAGVLHLSQSIIDLLYHFFPQSIDILKPETSRISGETPVLLECVNNENAIDMIFGNRSDGCSNMEGFGAEQVILVRDDSAQKEIFNYVGKKALVLTILECKGLEFQDVLLYNFFSSSPLKNKWRVIYKYMEEQDMFDSSLSQSVPQFSKSKHGILCSELKQLYVAVTRTRQRLWFCENDKQVFEPLFDYWKKKCAVQVQQLDDSLAQSMQASSSKEEWRSKGIKLYHEHNYKMATLCFERAGDAYWEKRSKASSRKAYAESIRSEHPKEANAYLREAAEIFEAIGKADSAAQCYFDIGEFERAGWVFLEKCEESELDRAGECFLLAKCYDRAADAYARCNFFADCLNACTKGQLFDMGSQYILSWKHDSQHNHHGTRNNDIEKLEQEFLENCARYYHSSGDNRSMMRSVKAFSSVDLMRKFLKSLNCVSELILLEEDLGNFLEAAKIAMTKGDLLHVADLLGKAGNFHEALMLLVQYVLAHSLWSQGSRGWPLKPFEQKQELLRKAKSFAENDSRDSYECICAEADILSIQDGNLETLGGFLAASKKHSSFRGEIITVRKILDVLLHLHSSKFSWEEKLVPDLMMHSEEMILKNQASAETMVYFWSCWKDSIVNIFESLQTLAKQDTDPYGEFCLHFFGVWRLNSSSYILLSSEADWAKKVVLHRNGKLVSIDAGQFISSARGYWCSELLASGFEVLKVLESLHKFSNKLSTFSQCRLLTHIFEVARFLLHSKYLNHGYHDKMALDRFCSLATGMLQSYLLAPNWKVSLEENVVSLRISSVFQNLLKKSIAENVSLGNQPTYGQFGKTAMLILGSGKLDKMLYEELVKWSVENPPWSAFIQEIHNITAENYAREITLVWRFHEALRDTYRANWLQARDYISPFCFLYLVEHLVITMSSFHGHFVTTKSSFVEWLIFHQGNSRSLPNILGAQTQQSFEPTLRFLYDILDQILFNKKATQDWMRKLHHNIWDLYPVLIQRLVVIVCLLQVNFQNFLDILHRLVGCNFITEHLPPEFCNALKGKRKTYFPIDKIAEFFKGIENPMVIVSLVGNRRKFVSQDAIFVDVKNYHGINDILTVLFPKKAETSESQNVATAEDCKSTSVEMISSNSCKPEEVAEAPLSSNSATEESKKMESQSGCENVGDPSMAVGFWEIFEALKPVENERGKLSALSNAPQIKMDVENWICRLTEARSKEEWEIPLDDGEGLLLPEVDDMVHELISLSTSLSMSEPEKNISEVGLISKSLSSKRVKLEPVLTKLLQEGCKTEAAVEKLDVEDAMANEKACSGNSSNGETAEPEPVEAENITSKMEGKLQGGEKNKGKGKAKPKPKPKKNKKGKGRRN